MSDPLHIILLCAPALAAKVRYVFDTLLLAGGVPVAYVEQPPTCGPWVLYGRIQEVSWPLERCLALAHCPDAWRFLEDRTDVEAAGVVDGLVAVLPQRAIGFDSTSAIGFDIVANSFYFLSSWSERVHSDNARTRRLYSNSVHARLNVPQDIVDQYLHRLVAMLDSLCDRVGQARWRGQIWPDEKRYALVLSHDVDFLPRGLLDTVKQGVKTVLRHLVRQRDAADAIRAAAGLARAILRGRDPYGCIPEIIRREKELGVRASFQVAVGHRHPDDVNYRIEDDRIRAYLQAIPAAGFDLCLHGSYRSTENLGWYVEEVALLAQRLGRPLGSRQHFLSFDYDALFAAQEQAGIQYDMSHGLSRSCRTASRVFLPLFPVLSRSGQTLQCFGDQSLPYGCHAAQLHGFEGSAGMGDDSSCP